MEGASPSYHKDGKFDCRFFAAGGGVSLRRFPEALATVDLALALEPANTDALGLKASVFWATGDLQAVEPLLANPGTEPHMPGTGIGWPVRGVQALFQRRYAVAIEILSS